MRRILLASLIVTVGVIVFVSHMADPSRGGFDELNRYILENPGMMQRSWPLYAGSDSDPALRVILNMHGGDVHWVLRDPHGDIRWIGQLSGSQLHRETMAFDPVPGVWTVEFRAEGSGVFEFRWKGFSYRPPSEGTG